MDVNITNAFIAEKDGDCPRCGRTLRTVKVSGRTAYVCASCQDKGAGG